MAEKEKVGPGKFVTYAYRLTDASNGDLLFEAKADAPDMMVYGLSQEIVPGLIAAMKDLSAGDRFSVTLPPAAAFGDVHPDNVVELDREIFMRDGEMAEEVKEGAFLPMMTAEGYRIQGKVLEVGDVVKMDFNHPFAGKTVQYDGEIIDVHEATPDELKTLGGGCCGGGCGCKHDEGSSCNSCESEGGCGGCH